MWSLHFQNLVRLKRKSIVYFSKHNMFLFHIFLSLVGAIKILKSTLIITRLVIFVKQFKAYVFGFAFRYAIPASVIFQYPGRFISGLT